MRNLMALTLLVLFLAGCTAGPPDPIMDIFMERLSNEAMPLESWERLESFEASNNEYVVYVRLNFKPVYSSDELQEMARQEGPMASMEMYQLIKVLGDWENGETLTVKKKLSFLEVGNEWTLTDIQHIR